MGNPEITTLFSDLLRDLPMGAHPGDRWILPSVGWVGLFFGTWLLLWLPLAWPLAQRLQWRPFRAAEPQQKLPLLALLYLLAPLVLWGVQRLAGTPWSDYGLQRGVLPAFLGGLLAGILGMGMLYGLQTRLRGKSLESPAIALPTVLTLLGVATGVSVIEELVFRGFLQSTLAIDLPPWPAAAIASLIFALLHLVWDGRGTLPQLPGLWLMGMVLTLARMGAGGHLGLAMGLHAGWVWGVAMADTHRGDRPAVTTPAWLMGIGGHPLASPLGLLLLLGSGGGLWLLPHLTRSPIL
jgi:membrane protease YdiL (CAAX protease family)